MEIEQLSLHELKIWISGFAAGLEKEKQGNPINADQWSLVVRMIMEAEDASTVEAAAEAATKVPVTKSTAAHPLPSSKTA